jgi:hypothetical protein
MNKFSQLGIPEELQAAAKNGIGRDWEAWADALSALTNGLGNHHARINPFEDVSIAIATTAGWHLDLSDLFWEHMKETIGPLLLRSGYLLDDSVGAEDSYDEGNELEEFTRIATGESFRIPLMRAVADVVSPDVDSSERIIGGYKPLGFGGSATRFLVAVSAKGIWRVSQSGDHFYWSRWDQVLSARLFKQTRFSAGSTGSENVTHALLLTAPQKREQLHTFSWWSKTFVVLEEILAVKEPQSGELTEEEAGIIVRGIENPDLIFGYDRAEFFCLDESDAVRIELAIENFAGSHSSKADAEAIVGKIVAFTELSRLGLGQLIAEEFHEEDWLIATYECSSCGRLAKSKDLVDLLFEEMAKLNKLLPDELLISSVMASIIAEEEPGKVRPALLQREFDLSFESAVEILDVAKKFGYGSDASCVVCISRRFSKKEAASAGFTRDALPPSIRFAVLQRDGFRCRYCGQGTQSNPPVELEVDHIVPVAAGGNNDLGNLVASCVSCNRGKSASSVV